VLHPFDPGYVAEPFRTLCADYPESDVYPSTEFRLEWRPIFHRGRLDVVDDDNFLDEIEQQPNVPDPIKNGLRALY